MDLWSSMLSSSPPMCTQVRGDTHSSVTSLYPAGMPRSNQAPDCTACLGCSRQGNLPIALQIATAIGLPTHIILPICRVGGSAYCNVRLARAQSWTARVCMLRSHGTHHALSSAGSKNVCGREEGWAQNCCRLQGP